MSHVHSGLMQGLLIYGWWLVFHWFVQVVLAPLLRDTRFGHALAAYG